jgi:hypothetical protein
MPAGFESYITRKAQEINKLHNSIPENQRNKIDQYLIENPDKAIKSKQFQAFLHDYYMFGDDVFK